MPNSGLFARRHYEALARVLGAAYYHVKSPAGTQVLDLVLKMFERLFAKDSPRFDAARFRQSVLMHTSDHAPDREVEKTKYRNLPQ